MYNKKLKACVKSIKMRSQRINKSIIIKDNLIKINLCGSNIYNK